MHDPSRLDNHHWIPIVVGLAWVLFALHSLDLFGDAADAFFDSWLYMGLLAAAAAGCLARALSAPAERLAWALMGAAIAVWSLGELAWSSQLATLAGAGTPSISDSLYLAFYPLAYATLVVLIRRQAGLASRDLWLDGVIGASCATAFAIAVAFPAFDVNGDDALELATTLAYPVLDIVLLSFVILVFGLSGWRPGRRWTLIGAGLTAMALSDGIYLVQVAHGSYAEGGPIDAGWPAAALLVALAAWQPPGTPGAPRETDRRLVLVPVFCGLVALALVTLAVFEALPQEAAPPALLTLLLVTGRMGMAFIEGQHTMDASRREALTDGLTGLGNRRALLADLERAVMRATADDPRVCVLLDLNGFKAYNDAFGHPAGDELLHRLGQRLQEVVDGHGCAYRLGGDEFCVLGRRHVGGGRPLADIARAALTETGEAFAVTSSAGIVELPIDAQTPADVLQVADRRMYADKGRRSSSAGHQSRAVLLRILREREPEMHDHLVGVAELALAVARELGMAGEELDELARAAELHDIGKIAVPDEILRKPGPLDRDEWAFVRSHPVIGERILGAAPALRPVARIVRSSHERWDGSGYPDGLAGEQIPLGARIVAVCDAYEAMVSDRPYRPALTPEQAVAELREHAGSQFDPTVVRVFTAALSTRSPEPLAS
ncbi:MAG TPA: diguanylate cyclase [Thermoleophilaceae bacterium]|nr:diguanylate cyclase [Thermoleophilaceae bacterium]